MPAYQQPFSQLGGAAGGTFGGVAGAGAGASSGILGQLLAPLDYPRKALWNLARSGGRALSGEGDWGDVASALPGALGAGLAGGLMLSGVGAPLGIAAGSALGGLAQGVGKATGKEAFNAPEVSDLTGTEDFIPNALVGALTDPLTYAGGIGGAAKGAARGAEMGAQFGKGLEKAALMRGPNYAGGAEKLGGLIEQALERGVDPSHIDILRRHVDALKGMPGALGEIPPGSTFGGMGQSTLTLRRPEGGVVQLTPKGPAAEIPTSIAMGRPDIPEMLQAERAKVYSEPSGYARVEHSPAVDVFPHMGTPPGVDPDVWYDAGRAMNKQAMDMHHEMKAAGGPAAFVDPHVGNIGFDASGNRQIIDAGSVRPQYNLNAGPGESRFLELPRAQDITGQPSTLQNIILRLLGSDKSVQAELASKLGKQSVQGSPIMEALLADSRAKELAKQPGQSAFYRAPLEQLTTTPILAYAGR